MDPLSPMGATMPGLPGLRGLDHIGFTVPDLEQAHTWLIDVIGCEYMYRLGPFYGEDDWMSVHLNVDSLAVMRELRFYRCGGQAVFEVFQYEAPETNDTPPRNSDMGGHHIALYVDDLDSAIEHLRAHHITILGEPTASKGASEGQRWVYFMSPWGMQFELVSYPNGKSYDKDPSRFA
jgi:catechol 2,3-dioxygenase-like lactoylglutathione lyase family enzyme